VRRKIDKEKVSGIIEFHGSYSHGDTFCILLEYANLGNLEQLLKVLPPPLEPQDILDFWDSFFSLLSPVAHLHGHSYEQDNQIFQL
jgi:cephalosporin-C deacetylase-like acetyl esterase